MTSLRDKTVSGMIWSSFQKFGSQGVAVLTSIILARILMPKDFGLIGMLTIFISVSQGIADGGFNKALIQKRDADDEDYSTVFFINLIVSSFLYLVLYFTAPLIAKFYDQPLLISLIRVLSLSFVINSFSYVQVSRLRKEMEFKKLMIIHLPSILLSAIVAITLAYKGFGVWSLVAQQLTERTAYGIQVWLYARWKPIWVFNIKKARGLFSYGGRLMLSSALDKIFNNIYLVVIGKFYPIEILGYYKNANSLTKIPSITLTNSIKDVTFSTFSAIQKDNKRLKKGYKKTIQLLVFIICPVMVFGGIIATPLIRLVLTEKWLPAVPYFQIMCVIGILMPINSFNLDVVAVKGRSDIYLKLNILKKIIMAIGIAATVFLGIWYLLFFQVFYYIIEYWMNSYYSGKFINYPLREQLKDIYPILVITIVMGAIVYCLDIMLKDLSDFFRVLIGGLMGVISYITLAYFFRISSFDEVLMTLRSSLIPKIKQLLN